MEASQGTEYHLVVPTEKEHKDSFRQRQPYEMKKTLQRWFDRGTTSYTRLYEVQANTADQILRDHKHAPGLQAFLTNTRPTMAVEVPWAQTTSDRRLLEKDEFQEIATLADFVEHQAKPKDTKPIGRAQREGQEHDYKNTKASGEKIEPRSKDSAAWVGRTTDKGASASSDKRKAKKDAARLEGPEFDGKNFRAEKTANYNTYLRIVHHNFIKCPYDYGESFFGLWTPPQEGEHFGADHAFVLVPHESDESKYITKKSAETYHYLKRTALNEMLKRKGYEQQWTGDVMKG